MEESTKFQNLTYSSAFQIDKWNSPSACVSSNTTFNVVFSATNSSRYLGNIVVSEVPQTLSVIGVSEQLNPPLATGSGGLAVDGSVSAWCGHSTNSCAASLTTSSAYDIIIVYTMEALDLQSSCTFSVSDIAGLSWTARTAVVFGNNGRDQLQEFYAKSSSALSSDTITESISGCASTQYGGEYNGFMAFGVSGTSFNSPFDPNISLPGTASGNSNTPTKSVSTTNANDMIIGAARLGGLTSGSGFTRIVYADGTNDLTEYKIVSSAVTNLAVAFSGNTGYWEEIADALQAPVPGILSTSYNYAGYEVYTNGNQNGVVPLAATYFYQPVPTYPPGGCADFYTCNFATWVGLQDTWNQSDGKLAQAGTWADWVNASCAASYFAWYGVVGGNPPFVKCTGSNNVIVNGADKIFAYAENEAAYGGQSNYYDFEVYDYQSNTSCISTQNSLNMNTPHFADYVQENSKECFIDCASLASFATAHFFSAQLYSGLNPPVDTFIYQYTTQGFYYAFNMTNAPCTAGCGGQKTCGTYVTNVSTGAVDPSSSFDETWQTSYYTPTYNSQNC